LIAILASPSPAADRTWTGAGASLNWSDDGSGGGAGNWGGVGILPASGDRILYDAGSANTTLGWNNLAGLSNMMIGSTNPAAGVLVNGAQIGVADGASQAISNSSGQVLAIDAQIILNSDATFARSGAGDLWLRSVINLNGQNLTLQGDMQVQDVIQGSGNVNYNGTITINPDAQTYSGRTIVLNGAHLIGGRYLPTDTALELRGTNYVSFTANRTIGSLSDDGSGNGEVGINGGVTLTAGGDNSSTSYAGWITGGGTFNKDGTGTMTLTGTVQDALRLNNGTLVINGTAQNSVSIDGGTLMGTGTCNGLLYNAMGNLAPGNSIGIINAAGGLTMDATGTYVVEVSGAAGDQTNVTGAVTLNTPMLNVTGTPTQGASFIIINNDGGDAVAGIFNGLIEGATFMSGGYQYQITYAGGDGNEVVLTALTGSGGGGGGSTPEPEPEPTPEAPPAPTITQGTSPSPTGSLGGPTLSWPHVDGSNFYRIYRAECPLCPRVQVGRVPVTWFDDVNAIPGQPYYYWVRTENGGGLSDYSNWMVAWRYEQNPGRAGDFNGDGIMDLLWWDPATGELTIWFMNGGEVQSVSGPGQGLDISQWLLVGTGDFNGDGVWDLLWWNPESGEVLVWYLENTQATASGAGQWLVKSASALDNMLGNAAIAYPGDLNGDGRIDILWRDYATGQVTVWLMGQDGKPQLNGPPTPAAEGITQGDRPGLSGTLSWQVAGLVDAGGDGKADAIWKNALNNHLATWTMDGSIISDLIPEDRGRDVIWRLSGLGDLNADQNADIVWRHDQSGEVQAWLMLNGVFNQERTILAGSETAALWQVKAVGDFCTHGCDDLYCKNSDNGVARIVTLAGQEYTPAVE